MYQIMSEQIPRTIGAPVAAGLAAMALTAVLSSGGNARILGVSLPVPVVTGVTVAAASGISELAKNHIVPAITSDPLSMTATHLIQPAITGAAAVASTGLLVGFNPNIPLTTAATSSFLVGAGSQLVANYAGEAIDRFVMSLMPGTTNVIM